MALTTMYPVKTNSPELTLQTALTADPADHDIVISGDVPNKLPAASNIFVIGTGEDAETVYYPTAYTGTDPYTFSGVTRAFQGTVNSWSAGTSIARLFTAYDHDTFRTNILELDSSKADFTVPNYDYVVQKVGTYYSAYDKSGTLVPDSYSTSFHVTMNYLFAAAASESVIVIVPGSYTITSPTTDVTGKSFTIYGYGATITNTATTYQLFDFFGTVVDASDASVLTASPVANDIHVDVTTATDYSTGKLIKIYDDEIFGHEGGIYDRVYRGEISKIDSVATKVINLQDSLFSGYLTGSNANAVPITPISIKIYGLKIVQPSSTGSYQAIRITYGKDCVVKDCTFDPIGYLSVEFTDCYNVLFTNNTCNGGECVGSGYGVVISGACRHVIVSNNIVTQCRHCLELGTYYADPTIGQAGDVIAIGNTLSGDGQANPVDVHLGWTTYIFGNTIDAFHSTTSDAIELGSKYALIEGNLIRNAQYLFQSRSEVYNQNVVIKNNIFYGESDSLTYIVNFQATTRGTFDRLVIEGNEMFNAACIASIDNCDITQLIIRNNTLDTSTYAQANSTTGLMIKGNTGTPAAGYYADVTIDGNVIKNTSSHGMLLRGVYGTCRNNKILNVGRVGSDKYGLYLLAADPGLNKIMVSGNHIENNVDNYMSVGILESNANNSNTFSDNIIIGAHDSNYTIAGTTSTGLIKYGRTSIADGGTITHGLSATPTWAIVTPITAGEFATVTTLGATTLTVAIKKHDNSAGTTQYVSWMCGI